VIFARLMKDMKIRREGPAPETRPPIGFDTFHQKTRATFRPCRTPDREPDFVSPGRSVYWDLGDRVVRASDHWSGQNGCEEIGGCVWTYAGACRPGAWEVGSCRYGGFAPGVRVFPTRPATPEDVALARLLRASGGGVDPKHLAGKPVPDWARVAPRGTIASRPAEAALRARPDLVRVLTADEGVVRRILETGEVPLPSRIS
jgi:hypothetical protein